LLSLLLIVYTTRMAHDESFQKLLGGVFVVSLLTMGITSRVEDKTVPIWAGVIAVLSLAIALHES
jgi:hypothetical protein